MNRRQMFGEDPIETFCIDGRWTLYFPVKPRMPPEEDCDGVVGCTLLTDPCSATGARYGLRLCGPHSWWYAKATR